MLGNAMLHVFSESAAIEAFGTVRSEDTKKLFDPRIAARILAGCDVESDPALFNVFDQVRPSVVINCVSPSKLALRANDALRVIPLCALLPHRLAKFCSSFGARLVQMGTDGVFSGEKGDYKEDDRPDAEDLYGLSKRLGEVHYPHTITIRTSIIGHELGNSQGLLSWFLAQHGQCTCFSGAIFSGLPTVVLAQIIRDVVIPRPDLFGVYHIAARPISKCDLLRLIAKVYGKSIELIPDSAPVIDRSLNSERFRAATGYVPPDWPTLIQVMHSSR
jgi:dTDP-4-dehydrorhamnose reductase